MRRVLFLDLDDTLFHSRRKREPTEADEAVAWAPDGTPDSFMNVRQRAFFDWIVEGAEVVPTTGRPVAAYRRVRLPFVGWAICSFGGVIVRPDGVSDPRWRAGMAPAAHAVRATLDALTEIVVAAAGVDRARVIEEDGMPLYVSAKARTGASLEPVAAALRPLVPPGWRVHGNGDNLAVLPPHLGKEHAVRWFLETVSGPDTLSIGAGDSTSDGAYLAVCHYALTPGDSQLLAHLLRP